MNRSDLDFEIRGRRLYRGGVSRTASAEEIRLWEALADNDEDEGDSSSATGAQVKPDGERLNHYEMTEEVNAPVTYAREVTHPTPQEAISRRSRPNKHATPEEVKAAQEERDEGGEDTNPGLAGVDFTSDVAAEAASDAGLTADDFAGQTGSGVDGAFTKADVTTIASDKEAENG